MLLLVGLGNPGQKYQRHRHNIGFMAVDEIVRRHFLGASRNRFQAIANEGEIDGQKVLALKPQTFMNDSGRSVGEAARFYKIEPDHIIVFHDELDLASGKIKVKTGGGVAGHNGLKSIKAHIGDKFRRVRMGVGHPGDKERVLNHVLGDFSKADQVWLEPLLEGIAEMTPWLVRGDDPGFMSKLAEFRNPPRKNPKPVVSDDASARTETKSTPGVKSALMAALEDARAKSEKKED